MARFLLNLRDQRHQVEDFSFPLSTYTDSLYYSTPPLSSVKFGSMGSMGGFVADDDDDDDDDDDGREEKDEKKAIEQKFPVVSHRRPDSQEVWAAPPPPPGLETKELKGVLVLSEKETAWV